MKESDELHATMMELKTVIENWKPPMDITPKQACALADVLKQWSEGAALQWRFKEDTAWQDYDDRCARTMHLSNNVEVRIKPKPLGFWINIYPVGNNTRQHVYETEEKAFNEKAADAIRQAYFEEKLPTE